MSSVNIEQVSLDEALNFLGTEGCRFDFLKISTDHTLLETLNSSNARLGSETVLFSDEVLRFTKSKRKKPSERELVITNTAIYLFKAGQYKKADLRIDILTAHNILVRRDSTEVLLRLLSGPDLLLQVVRADECVAVLCDAFAKVTGEELRVGRPRSSSLFGLANFDRKEIMIPHSPMSRNSAGKHDFVLGIPSPTAAGKRQMEVFEGWLANQSSSVGGDGWRRRWTVLNDQNVTYYDPKERSTSELTEGSVKMIDSAAGEVMAVLDDAIECHKFIDWMRLHEFSLDVPMCYLDIKAFERCESGSNEQMRFLELIDAKYMDEGSDHFMDNVDDSHRRVIDALLRSGLTRSDSLTEFKKDLVDKINADAFPKFNVKNPKKRRRSFFNDDADLIACPDGLFSFQYTPKKGKNIVLAAEDEIDMLKWVQTLEDVVHDLAVGRSTDRSHIEGWLHVMQSDKTWYRAYYVLDGARLRAYDMKYKGSIVLAGGSIQSDQIDLTTAGSATPTLPAAEAERDGFRTRSRFAFRFNVTTRAGEMFCLATDSHPELLEWLRQIQRRIDANESDSAATNMSFRIGRNMLKALAQEPPTGDVAIVFTDVQNSTDLWENHQTDMEQALKDHDSVLRQLVVSGYEVKTEGDAFMVAFPDPLSAVQWCIAVQKELLAVEWPQGLLSHASACEVASKASPDEVVFKGLRVRMGVCFGQPNCRENPVTHRMDYFGNVVNKTARVSDSAHGGQIIMTSEVKDYLDTHKEETSEAMHAFTVTDLGRQRYKGIKGGVNVHGIVPDGVLSERSFLPLRVHHPADDSDLSGEEDTH